MTLSPPPGATLAKALSDARDEVARLERAVAGASCREVGCDMKSVGGCNAGCGDGCGCSVPVFVCTRCGDSDYGDNEEARQTREDCETRAALSTPPKENDR